MIKTVNFEMVAFSQMVNLEPLDDVMNSISSIVSQIDSRIDMSVRDRRKIGVALVKALNADKGKKFGNCKHIDQVLGLIEKVQKLNIKALDDAGLKDKILNQLWIIYADIEYNGLDNAHWTVSDIPCSDRGLGKYYNNPAKRIERKFSRETTIKGDDIKIVEKLCVKFRHHV